MGTDIERLAVLLEARVNDFDKRIAASTRAADRNFRKIETAAQRMQKSVSNTGAGAAGFGRAFVAGLVPAVTIQALGRLSDAATRVDNALKVSGLSGEELERVYRRLRDSAVKNAAPLETLVTLYGRASLVQKELNVTQEEMLNFTDKIALALRVSGQSAAESSGALLQLSQALGAGTVRAEEFNSILEGALPIAQAAAAGLEEAGGSVAKLRQLVVDGKISSEAFFRAFEAGSVTLEDKVAGSTLTVSQSTGNLWTALVDVTREFNNSTGAAENFAGGLDGAAQSIASFDVSGLIGKIRDAGDELRGLMQDFGNADFWKSLNQAMGVTDSEGNALNPDVSQAEAKIFELERDIELLQQRIELNTELGIDNSGALSRLAEVRVALAQVRADAANLPATVDFTIGSSGLQQASEGSSFRVPFNPLPDGVPPALRTVKTRSLSEFKVPSASGGVGRKGGSGGGENGFEREVQQIEERAEALRAETAALASINPLVKDYGFSLEQARSKQDLLTAAKKAGIAVTPDLEEKIEVLATAYATASAEAEKLADGQDQIRRSAEEWASTSKAATKGFIQDLVAGKSATEALAGALEKLADKFLDSFLDAIFDINKAGGSGGGFLGNIFGSIFGGGQFGAAKAGKLLPGLFAEGGWTGHGGKYEPAGTVHKGEYVFDQDSVRAAGGPSVLDDVRRRLRGYSGGGSVGAFSAASIPMPRMPSPETVRPAAPQIQYVPVPYLVETTVSDDGRILSMMRKVSGDTMRAESPKIVGQSVAAVGKRARQTKSYLG